MSLTASRALEALTQTQCCTASLYKSIKLHYWETFSFRLTLLRAQGFHKQLRHKGAHKHWLTLKYFHHTILHRMNKCSLIQKQMFSFIPVSLTLFPSLAGHVRARATAQNLLMPPWARHTLTTQWTRTEVITTITKEHSQCELWEMLLSLPWLNLSQDQALCRRDHRSLWLI